jgi:hypothetical protein
MDVPSVMFPPKQFPNRPKKWGLKNFIDAGLSREENRKVLRFANKPPIASGKAEEEVRFGLIGEGRISGRHKVAIEKIGGKVVSIYDPAFTGKTAENCLYHKELSRKFFDSVHWVVVTSPTFLHYEHVKMALTYGKKVICEKPYVLPWQPLIDSKDVFIVLQLRWANLPRKAKEIRLVAARNIDYFDSWKGAPEKTGGLFFDLFIHYLDLARGYNCLFRGIVKEEGKQERWIDNYDLMNVNMDVAYERMYRDIVFRGMGVHPQDITELNWLLGRFTERFGSGREILNKEIMIDKYDLV